MRNSARRGLDDPVAHQHRTQSKPRRQQRRGAARADKGPKVLSSERPVVFPHPTFGEIPMVPISVVQPDGSVREGRDFDPDYQPIMPTGAVRGDIRRQEFCRMCHVPRYFYVDIPRRCVECREPFVFSAKEQKHWFEALKFHFDSIPIRCVACRRKKRSDKALGLELSAAKRRLRDAPESPAAHVALAEAIVRLHQRSGQGKLAEALAVARKARRLSKDHAAGELSESYYWEAACQALLGKSALVHGLYARFLDGPGGGKRRATLVREAKAWLPLG